MNDDDKEMVMHIREKYKLTHKQALFVLYWNGNATQTARKCGYSNPESNGIRVMNNDKVKLAIKRFTAPNSTPSNILTRNDLMQIWSDIARDSDTPPSIRLKAMDSLAKSQGIFIDRSQVISNVRIEHLDKLSDAELIDKLNDTMNTLQECGITLQIPYVRESSCYGKNDDE